MNQPRKKGDFFRLDDVFDTEAMGKAIPAAIDAFECCEAANRGISNKDLMMCSPHLTPEEKTIIYHSGGANRGKTNTIDVYKTLTEIIDNVKREDKNNARYISMRELAAKIRSGHILTNEETRELRDDIKQFTRKEVTKTPSTIKKRTQIDDAIEYAKKQVDEIMGFYRMAKDLKQQKANMNTDRLNEAAGKAMQATNSERISTPQSDFRQQAIIWKNDFPELTAIMKNLSRESVEFEKRAMLAEDEAKAWKNSYDTAMRSHSSALDRVNEKQKRIEELSGLLHQADVRKRCDDDDKRKMNECARAMLETLKADGFMKKTNFRRFKKALTGFIGMTYTPMTSL